MAVIPNDARCPACGSFEARGPWVGRDEALCRCTAQEKAVARQQREANEQADPKVVKARRYWAYRIRSLDWSYPENQWPWQTDPTATARKLVEFDRICDQIAASKGYKRKPVQ